jgi:hypothetical protein
LKRQAASPTHPAREGYGAASGQKVGFKVYLDEIDRVLASSNLKTHQRIQLKTMLDRHGFIKVRR